MSPALPSFLRRTFARCLTPSFVGYLTFGLIALGMTMGYRWSARAGLSQLAAVATERLELYSSALEAELARHAYLPNLIAIDEDITKLFDAPRSKPARERASLRLARINVRAGSLLIFITDAEGDVIAASSDELGQSADKGWPALSPSVANALMEGTPNFFAANQASGFIDHYFVHAVRRDGNAVGQIVVKVNLAPLEATWIDLGLRSQSEKLLVVDENDVVIMSSVPAWKYRTLGAVNQAFLRSSGRYPGLALAPLEMVNEASAGPGATIVTVADGSPNDMRSKLLAQERPIVTLAVRLLALSDPSDVWSNARHVAWGGGAGGAFVGILALYLLLRRRALLQARRASEELRKAHDHLERQIDERTSQLRLSNDELRRQIEQRLRAEDELMQAGKLAVLGQMSAGISHEINQPLTALRALSRNTLLLLEGGRNAAVADNLRSIDQVAERISRISRQLKTFARKADALAMPAPLLVAINNVRLLLEHRLREEQVEVRVSVADDLHVSCDINRLEQVLVNLASNALDAMAGCAEKVLTIAATTEAGRVHVRISDTGPGMDEALMQRLFEPFFTTKPPGQGLGLGLVISSKIVHEFGGTLRAQRGDAGLVFEFDLEASTKEGHV